MADRIFGVLALLISIGYGYIAFTIIKAPFQYDPLGPESWPRILSVLAACCCVFIIFRPDDRKFRLEGLTLLRIAIVIFLLGGYAYLFEPLGFILSTCVFCTLLSRMLGSSSAAAVVFGAASGILGYGLCVGLLDLNLPAGVLRGIL